MVSTQFPTQALGGEGHTPALALCWKSFPSSDPTKTQSVPGTAMGVEGVSTQDSVQSDAPKETDIVSVDVDAHIRCTELGKTNPSAATSSGKKSRPNRPVG
jgi:hypothetical protein